MRHHSLPAIQSQLQTTIQLLVSLRATDSKMILTPQPYSIVVRSAYILLANISKPDYKTDMILPTLIRTMRRHPEQHEESASRLLLKMMRIWIRMTEKQQETLRIYLRVMGECVKSLPVNSALKTDLMVANEELVAALVRKTR